MLKVLSLRERKLIDNTGEVTLSQLIKWADKSLTKTTNQPALPRVIIIVNGPRIHTEEWLNEDTVTGELLDRFRAMEIIDPGLRKIAETWSSPVYHIASSPRSLQDLLELYFSGIRVVYIPSKELVAPDVLQGQIFQLRNRLLTESQLVQNKRRLVDSAQHTPASNVFNKAFVRFTTAPDHPFDFYAVLKSISLPPQNFGEYIVELMEAIEMIDMGESITGRDDRLAQLLASYISFASLNNNTNNSNFIMHPNMIFEEHYRVECEAAYTKHYQDRCAYQVSGKRCMNTEGSHERFHQDRDGLVLGEGKFESSLENDRLSLFLERVKTYHRTRAEKLRDFQGQTDNFARAVILEHRKTLKSERDLWEAVFSNVTCFFCLSDIPQQVLACGHSLCESCLHKLGTLNRQLRDIKYPACDLCLHTSEQEDELWSFRLKPVFAGVRVLSLDGGGVRGVISATILEALEEEIGLNIPIHQFFDLIVGTSTGGIIALSLACNLWRASECLKVFSELAKTAFTPHSKLKFLNYILSLFHDSLYKSKHMNSALKLAFEEEIRRPLFGSSSVLKLQKATEKQRSLKVAVVTTDCLTDEAVLMSNYNKRDQSRGTRICRQNISADELEIWEAGRCTSAAPAYFTPYSTSIGAFQDGGLKHNCPLELAIEESRIVWEQGYHMDLAVSVGTSQSKADNSLLKPTKQHKPPPVRHFTARLYNSFMNSIDTEPIWKAFAAKMSKQELKKTHRLNMAMNNLPALDDVSQITSMHKQTIDQFSGTTEERGELRTTAHALIAALFYIEILEVNQLSPKSKGVKGQLMCRLEPKYQINVFEVFLLKKYTFKINEMEYKIPTEVMDTLRGDDVFRMEFEVILSRSEELSISLQFPSSTDGLVGLAECGHPISRCPVPYDELGHNEVYIEGTTEHNSQAPSYGRT